VSLSKDDVEEALTAFEAFLRRRRLKMTSQRRTMIQTALRHKGHFTAEDLYRRLVEAGAAVSMATVYRGLSLLEEARLLEGHDFDDGTRRYERLLDREHHDHMICLDCRRVLEFQDDDIESLQERAARRHGFELTDHRLVLYVRCPDGGQPERCARAEAMKTS
jgi:Fur family ferric uptake transcriptional regulator